MASCCTQVKRLGSASLSLGQMIFFDGIACSWFSNHWHDWCLVTEVGTNNIHIHVSAACWRGGNSYVNTMWDGFVHLLIWLCRGKCLKEIKATICENNANALVFNPCFFFIVGTLKFGCRASGLSKNRKGKTPPDNRQQSIKDLFSKFAFSNRYYFKIIPIFNLYHISGYVPISSEEHNAITS